MNSSQPEAPLRGISTSQENVAWPEGAQEQASQQGSSQRQDSVNLQPSNDAQPESSSKGEQESIKSWAAVEGEMKKEDEATMKGHMEDVDYLLVFAGLFSAVLTAFVVESYQQLQPDHQETSSKLLRRISIQLESFTLTPSFANSTLPVPALPSLDFTADVISRWINILWFLSLIFSLAAALFGILVKQWIREYMKWNAALAHPRDNVLVRQIRFEAWNDWNVPTTIAAVPALLEIALVFFVCGLVILLWTLDPVVSAVITTAAAVFLAIASTFTFLPAFFRRCPYKSPTAWAFAVFWDLLTHYIPHKLGFVQHQFGEWLVPSWDYWTRTPKARFGRWLKQMSGPGERHPRIGNWTACAHDWRSRDLANLWSSLWPGTKRGDAIPLLEDLRLERKGRPTGFDISYYPSTLRQSLPFVFHDAQRVITELSPLVGALAWVSQASQDAQTQAHVLSCIESLEARFTLPLNLSADKDFISNFLDEDGVRAVSYWNLALDLLRRSARSTGKKPEAEERRNMSTFLAKLQSVKEPRWVHWTVSFDGTSPEVPVFAHLLALSVRTLSKTLSNPLVSFDALNHLRTRNVLRLCQYLDVLRHFQPRRNSLMSNAGDHLYDTFLEMVNQESHSQKSLFLDWQPIMLEIIDLHHSPKLKKLMEGLEIDRSPDHPINVAKIMKALLSDGADTSHSEVAQLYAAMQDFHETGPSTSADDPTRDALETPYIHVALSSAPLRLPRRSASLPLVARSLPPYYPRRWSLDSLEPFHLLGHVRGDSEHGCTGGIGGLVQAHVGSRSKELPLRPSVALAQEQQNTANNLTGTSSSLLLHEPAGRTAVSSATSDAPEGVPPPDPSSSHIARSLSPSPSHSTHSELPLRASGIPAAEGQEPALDLTTSLPPSSPSRSDSGEHKYMGPTYDLAGNTPELPPVDALTKRSPTLVPSTSHTIDPSPLSLILPTSSAGCSAQDDGVLDNLRLTAAVESRDSLEDMYMDPPAEAPHNMPAGPSGQYDGATNDSERDDAGEQCDSVEEEDEDDFRASVVPAEKERDTVDISGEEI